MPLIPPSDDVLDQYPVLVFEEIHDSSAVAEVKSAPKVLCAPDHVKHVKRWHIVYPASGQLYVTTDAHKASLFRKIHFSESNLDAISFDLD